jgi:hypothetical protein
VSDLLRLLRRLFWVGGIGLTLLIVMQVAHFLLLLGQSAPGTAWALGVLLGGGVLGALGWFWWQIARYPRALQPPPVADPATAGHREMKAYCLYLRGYARRLAANPAVPEARQQALQAFVADLDSTLGAHPLNQDLRLYITRGEDEAIRPALAALREKAQAEVRASTRDVMLAVTFSPYPSIDLLVVAARNLGMTLRLVRLHATRPAPAEQWAILRDVARVVVTVNFLNAGRQLLENLFAHLPFVGRFVEDMAQGIGAGFLTSATGNAAIDRCAAFRGWDRAEAARTLGAQTRDFLADVRDMFTKDVLPHLRSRIRFSAPEAERQGEDSWWNAVVDGLSRAVDATAAAFQTVVVRPAGAAVQGVAQMGGAMAEATSRTSRGFWSWVTGRGDEPPPGGAVP